MMNFKLETENERWLCVEGLFTMMVSASHFFYLFFFFLLVQEYYNAFACEQRAHINTNAIMNS